MPAGTITTNANYPNDAGYRTKPKPGNANAQLHLSGTFDSATVQVQFKTGDGTWVNVSNGNYTTSGDPILNFPNAREVRLNVSGGGGSMAIVYDLY